LIFIIKFNNALTSTLAALDSNLVANLGPGLPDGAKFGKYRQKSPFSKKFANFFGNIF